MSNAYECSHLEVKEHKMNTLHDRKVNASYTFTGVFGFKNLVIEKVRKPFFKFPFSHIFFQVVHFSFLSSLFSLSKRVSFSN
jgi:hypothetical protein